jgi:uncharacterized protein (TIGR00369 family)
MSHTDNPSQSTPAHRRREISGLEYFQQMMAGVISPPPMVSLLGLRLVEVAEGRVVFVGTAHEEFYNGMGVAHGGWAATLLDTALGCAVNSGQPAGRSFTTLELKINYVRPLRHEVGEVRCEAFVIHAGNRTAIAEARVVDAAGKIYAHGTTTCMLVERTAER